MGFPYMSSDGSDEEENIDQLLAAIDRGEKGALPSLISVIYPELKRLAHFQLLGERPNHTLNTTAIVHEAYMRLSSQESGWKNRKHFLRAAASVMRHLLVDHARTRGAAKRGDGKANIVLDETRLASKDDTLAVLALNDAMKDIAEIDPRLEQVIECRFFAGLSVSDTAEALGMPQRTVERDLRRARAYLRQAMELNEGQ